MSDRPSKGALDQLFSHLADGRRAARQLASEPHRRPAAPRLPREHRVRDHAPPWPRRRARQPDDRADDYVFSTGATIPQFGILGAVRLGGRAASDGGARRGDRAPGQQHGLRGRARLVRPVPVGPLRRRVATPARLHRSQLESRARSRRGVGQLDGDHHHEPPVVELLAIPRDTNPPRMTALARDDSTDAPRDVRSRDRPGTGALGQSFRLQRADSTEVPIALVSRRARGSRQRGAPRLDAPRQHRATGFERPARHDGGTASRREPERANIDRPRCRRRGPPPRDDGATANHRAAAAPAVAARAGDVGAAQARRAPRADPVRRIA